MRVLPAILLATTLLLAGCTIPKPVPQSLYYRDLLGAEPYTRLVIQVDHAPGYAPSEAAKTHLLMTLKNVTRKSEIVFDVRESLPADARKVWTADELIQLEAATRRTPHEPPTALLHVLYPAGHYENRGSAGVAISGPVLGPVVVFLDVLRDVHLATPLGAVPLPNPDAAVHLLERSTLLHEAGHALGLVNNGLDMVKDREDADHEGHTTNRESVMYYAIATQNGLRELLLRDGSIPDEFDADDRADLRAAGGR